MKKAFVCAPEFRTSIKNFFIHFFIFFLFFFFSLFFMSYILSVFLSYICPYHIAFLPTKYIGLPIYSEQIQPPFLDDKICTREELSAQFDAWLKAYPYQGALEVVKPEIIEKTWNNSKTMLELKVRYLNFLGDALRFGFETNRMENLTEDEYYDIFISVWSEPIEEAFDLIIDPHDFAAYIYYYEPNPLQPWVDYYGIPNYTEES